MAKEVDIIIVGGGPGGYVAAIRGAQTGAKVALVHNDDLGGTCLNRGCIPSKALIHCARQVQNARDSRAVGVDFGEPALDFDRIRGHARRTVAQNVEGVKGLMKSHGVASIGGFGRLSGEHEVTVYESSEPDSEIMGKITAPNIIWATGSLPATPPIPGTDADNIFTSDEAVFLPGPPDRLAIIGAGALGCEFAYIYSQLGAEVHLVEMMDRVMPTEDPDVSEVLTSELQKLGVQVCVECRCAQISSENGQKRLDTQSTVNGQDTTLNVDMVLLAAGRRANTENMGLEDVGVEMDGHDIVVDGHLRTNIEGLYAIGDCVRGAGLAHQASCEGECVIQVIREGREADCRMIVPMAVYTHPEAASVGLRECDARFENRDIIIGRFPLTHLGKAAAIRERAGFVKVIIDADTHEVLGASIVAAMAADLIALFTAAVRNKMTAEQMAQVCQAHPTMFEAVREALLDSLGRAIHLNPN